MLTVRISTCLHLKKSLAIACNQRSVSDALAPIANELVPIKPVKYPPIEDISFKARRLKYKEQWAQSMRELKTVEEKMIKLNMPKFYGFKCIMYDEEKIFYNESAQAQYITRTHVAEKSELPSYYDNVIEVERLNNLTEKIKKPIEDAVVFELTSETPIPDRSNEFTNIQADLDDKHGELISKQVNRIMIASLAQEYKHLISTQVDVNPRIEAFWFNGGIDHSRPIQRGLRSKKWDDLLDVPMDRPMQYLGNPVFQLRHKIPLREIIPIEECMNSEMEVPVVKLDPRSFGHYTQRRHATTIPGFWPGDSYEFGFLSYHRRGYLQRRLKTHDDTEEALKTQAIFANYAWLLGQANHLGFSTYNDITYPLTNQLVITNGQFWSFSVYQMNTTTLYGYNCDNNPKRNVCWITEPLKLYEKIEDGKLVGFNDEVLKHLIKFYVNTPQERVGVEMRPYLDPVTPRVEYIKEDERRQWLEKLYKYLMSNRPRHRLAPELYHWERIYKHMFKQRPIDKKRTPWDFGINPYLRRLNEHTPRYIPKILRPEKEKKIRFERTYYP